MTKAAVILCGGRGTRLKPYTLTIPKPLVPIDGKPVLELVVRNLKSFGFEKLIFAVNHQADFIKAFFQDGSRYGVDISYSLESQELGTIAPLTLIENLPDNFLVLNADVLTDLDIHSLYDTHVKSGRLVTVAVKERQQLIDYGVLEVDAESKKVTQFIEKPRKEFLVSMGIYCFSKRILDHIPSGEKFGFDDLMYSLIKEKKEISTFLHKGYWRDIGRPEDYEASIDDYHKGFLKKND